ncbi:spermidine/putrescine transport system permease protein [Lachnospiraceae bacterium NE2001]|nr:spermidine/putrescine transport system permease protein [Lachnospiraceae bacterium NE2001]
MRDKKSSRVVYLIYITLLFIFFYLPIVVMMVFSFNSSKSLTNMTGFSLRWYSRLISDGSIMRAVYVSLTIAIFATIISVILGTITAIGLSKSRRVMKETILNINNLPIMNPDIVTAIGLMILFSSAMIAKGYMTMLLAHIAFCTPYVITSVYPKVRQLDPSLADAAMDLGATPFEALTKVIIPMLRDGIYAGILLAFTMSFDDFVISYFVTGNGVENISITVYNMTKRTNPTINALSTIVILVIAILLIVSRLLPAMLKATMKKIMAVALALLIGFTTFAGIKSNGRTLRIFISGEYLDPEIVEDFEKKYDCDIILETFDSNESMYTKLMSGSEYDILVTSDYMIERLIKEKELQPLNWDNIPNKDSLDPANMGYPFDPDNTYSVPYFVGTVGILYDTNVVDEADLEEGWELLRNPKYAGDIYMYDSERDSFMIALKSLGYSMNTTDKEEIKEAYDWLIDQRETMDVVYVGDDVMDNMISGNKSIAVVYSGDGAYIMAENEDLDYFDPEEGTNEWCDAMVMTKDCLDTELAEEFMNYMLEYDVVYQNSIFVGYTTPVAEVRDDFKVEEYDGIESYTPVFGAPNNEIFRYQDEELRAYYSDLWTKVKAY